MFNAYIAKIAANLSGSFSYVVTSKQCHVDIQLDKLDYLKKSQANFFQNLHQIKAFIMTNKMT